MIKSVINKISGLLHIKRRFYIPAERQISDGSICYAITVCNEHKELEGLLELLIAKKDITDEIIVQADKDNVTPEVLSVIRHYEPQITHHSLWSLNKDFAQAKNNLSRQTNCRYIFQLDADEMPSHWLLEHIHQIIAANPDIELFKLPRINLFINDNGETDSNKVSWPDYQGRIYLNAEHIRWHRPIHERIIGHKSYVYLPKDERYALIHIKRRSQDYAKWQQWKTFNK